MKKVKLPLSRFWEEGKSKSLIKKIFKWEALTALATTAAVVGAIIVGLKQNSINYNQLVLNTNTQQSDVLIEENNIEIDPNLIGPTGQAGDMIFPSVTNIGNSPAENISLSFYTIGYQVVTPMTMQFNGGIAQVLYPGQSIRFVQVDIPYEGLGNNLEPLIGKENLALIFHLHYTDSLTDKPQDRIFLYQYTLGVGGVASMLQNDYQTLYTRMVNGISSSSDPYMYHYLLENPSSTPI